MLIDFLTGLRILQRPQGAFSPAHDPTTDIRSLHGEHVMSWTSFWKTACSNFSSILSGSAPSGTSTEDQQIAGPLLSLRSV